MMIPFKLGFYFDMFSKDPKDWEKEARFNQTYTPDFLELMLEYPGSVSDFDRMAVDQLQEIVKFTPMTVHGPTLGITLCSASRRVVQAAQAELIDGLKICDWLGSKLYTLHGGEFPFLLALNGTSPAKEFIKNFRPVMDAARTYGIDVCLENLKGEKIFPKTYVELDEVFDAYPDLKLALDIRHCCVNSLDVLGTYERYRPKIPSIQYRDDCGLSDEQLRRFLGRLVSDGWAGNFIIEDPALNTSHKATKPMLDAGYKRVCRLLAETTVTA